MKLAEALAARADAQGRLQELRGRIVDNARHQEGDEPAEDPNALLEEADRVAVELGRLVRVINATNAATSVDGNGTITDAIAQRDALAARRRILADAAGAAAGGHGMRMMRSELPQRLSSPRRPGRRRDRLGRRAARTHPGQEPRSSARC